MRLRIAVLALLASALVAVSVPASSLAFRHHGPRHNHGLTINATPDPIIAGEGVLIYGQLNGPGSAGQTIRLYRRLRGIEHSFTLIGQTTTDSHGFYEFTRVEGVVNTNRDWFVRAPALPDKVHSRTVRELVAALVSIQASPAASTNGYDTKTPVVFSGHVTPFHGGETVALQQQSGHNGTGWKTIKIGRIGPASSYSIPWRFKVPGDHDLRVVFRGDARNIPAASDTLTVTIQQAEIPDFTINTSDPIIPYTTSATISGVLYLPGTTTPDPNVSVTLWGHTAGQKFAPIGVPVATGTDGSYSFTVTPGSNTEYMVRTTFAPPKRRHTAPLFEGVRDVVQMSPSSSNVVVGQPVLLSGSVSPDKAGEPVLLQRLGADGDWHTINASTINAASTFQFHVRFGNPGAKELRARVPGDSANVAGASAPLTINVALPPVNTLPTGPTGGS
jgi:hypothetical protein